jgi:hypothetical protein
VALWTGQKTIKYAGAGLITHTPPVLSPLLLLLLLLLLPLLLLLVAVAFDAVDESVLLEDSFGLCLGGD